MNPPIVFTDCDDTLFQTGHKCPGGNPAGLKRMSTLADGSSSGFATARQEALLGWLRAGLVIPVTARSREVLGRVDMEQAPAICSNGGCITGSDNRIDQAWHDRLVRHSAAEAPIADIYAKLTQDISADAFRHWIVNENGLDLYIVIKSNFDDAEGLARLGDDLTSAIPGTWRRHSNGNNLAFLPGWLNKRNAAAYLIEKLREEFPDSPIIGIGDSASDVGFMDLCDFAMAPTNSQLWQSVTHTSLWVA